MGRQRVVGMGGCIGGLGLPIGGWDLPVGGCGIRQPLDLSLRLISIE